MAKARKKAAKKTARKAGTKKTIAKRKPAAAPRGKSAKKASKKAVKTPKGRKSAPRRAAADGVRLGVSLELDTRLRDLATAMNRSLEEILIQALTEFADNWEDHMRTVGALRADDDRVQLAVPKDDNAP